MLKIARVAAAAAALMAGLTLTAEAACVGPDCPPSKPLDIQKIMREQAASTRVGESKRARPVAQASKPDKPKADTHKTQRIHTAKRKSAPPAEAPASFAATRKAPANPAPAVQVVAAEEFNAIDQAAPPAPAFAAPETVGSALSPQDVKMVVSAAFNEIDRKAQESKESKEAQADKSTALAMAEVAPQAQAAPAKAETVRSTSVMGWLWSGVSGTFSALTTAVRQLTGGVVP